MYRVVSALFLGYELSLYKRKSSLIFPSTEVSLNASIGSQVTVLSSKDVIKALTVRGAVVFEKPVFWSLFSSFGYQFTYLDQWILLIQRIRLRMKRLRITKPWIEILGSS